MIISELFEAPQQCPECGGISFSNLILAEKKDACYHKVKASAKVWPSAYASGRLVQCRKKGAANYGNKSEGVEEAKFPTPQDDRNFQDQADYGGKDPDARDRYGNLERSTSPGLGGTIDIGGVNVPVDALGAGLGSVAAIGSLGGMKGMFGKPRDLGTTSRDIATQRNVGGNPIPSLGQAGKVVTSPTMDKALVKLGGKNVSTTPGPTSKSASTNVQIDPAADVPAYVRQGKPDPVTTPVGKPKIIIRPGETMDQAIQRTKVEQEFGKFLQGQGGQKFGTPGAVNPEPAKPPQRIWPELKTDTQVKWDDYKEKYGVTHPDKIARDDKIAVDAMVKKARENAQARDAAQAAKEKQLGLEPGSLRPRSQWEKERDSALRSEEEKLGLPPGSLNPKPTEPKKPTTPGEKENSGIFNYIKNNPKKSTVAAIGAVSAADELLKDKKLKEQSPKKQPPEVDYDDEYQAMVARVRKLAGLGPMKTVWDPAKRVYKNVPKADQPQKK